MSHTNSQVSVEFIAIFFIFLLFTSTVLLMYVVKNEELTTRRVSIEAQALLNNIVTSVNTAIIRGDGFSIELDLPYGIYNSDYSIIINGSWVYVNITRHDMIIFKSLFSANITGTFDKGENIIRNVGGVIYLE